MRDTTIVSFPEWGIGELTLNKVAFTLFGKLEVRWYGLIITLGIIFAVLYVIQRGKKYEKVSSDDIIDIGILTVLLGVIGARLYYVLTSPGQFNSFEELIAIWNGGLGIYGGIIGGCLGIVIVCLIKKISWRKLFDMAAPGVMLAQAMGRWGNFFNGEAYGYAIGDTTKFYFFQNEFLLPSGEGTFFHFMRMGLKQFGTWVYYHPTFLYESVWNLLGFALANLIYKHKKFHGQIALMYFTWYGFGRMFIEGFRTDSLYIPGTGLRISQCVGLFCFVVGGTLLLVLSLRFRRAKPLIAAKGAEEASVVETPIVHEEDTRWGKLLEQKLRKHTLKHTNEEEKSNGDSN